MTENVVPRREPRRYRKRPFTPLVDELLRGPHLGRVVDAFGLNLHPFEVRLDDFAAVAVAGGYVAEDGTVAGGR